MEKIWNFLAVFVLLLLIVVGVIFGRLFLIEKQETELTSAEPASLTLPVQEEQTPEVAAMPEEKLVLPANPDDIVVLPAPTSLPAKPLPLGLAGLFDEPTVKEPVADSRQALENVFTSEPMTISQTPVITQSLTVFVEDTVVAKEEEKQPATESVTPVHDAPATPTSIAPSSYIYFFTGIPVPQTPMPTAPVMQFVYTRGFTSVSMTSTPVVQSYAVPTFVPQVVPSRIGAPKWGHSNGVVIKPTVYFPHQPLRNAMWFVVP